MITCSVIDAELPVIKVLKEYISITPDLKVLSDFQSPLSALEAFRERQLPDILFLDMYVPDLSVLQMSGYIPKSTEVIFTTPYSQDAVKAFECNAFDFLLKPVPYERFVQSIEKFYDYRLKGILHEQNDHLFIQSEFKGKLIRINFTDILYAESLKNYLKIHTKSGSYTTYLKMNELEVSLPEKQFIRVHKSFIINIKMILSVEKNLIYLQGDSKVNIGDLYREEFFNRVKEKLVKTIR